MADPSVRQSLQDVFREEFTAEYLREVVQQLKGAKEKVRGEWTCRHCDKRQITYVEIPDYGKILKEAITLLEQTEGKPGTLAVEDTGVTLIVERPSLRG